jgi:amino acid transporter
MFVLINGVQGNALQFGREVIVAGSSPTADVNTKLQKFFAVVIIMFVCQIQAYSRLIYVRICNTLAVLKLSALLFIGICGIIALAGVRKHVNGEATTPYGVEDLQMDFRLRSRNVYQYSLALLSIMRAFLGYENANFVRFVALATHYMY